SSDGEPEHRIGLANGVDLHPPDELALIREPGEHSDAVRSPRVVPETSAVVRRAVVRGVRWSEPGQHRGESSSQLHALQSAQLTNGHCATSDLGIPRWNG